MCHTCTLLCHSRENGALLHGSNFRCHSHTPLCHSRVGGNPDFFTLSC
ncbi:hypothetical protein [Rickettsia endosymbiont of Orchestes rusci]